MRRYFQASWPIRQVETEFAQFLWPESSPRINGDTHVFARCLAGKFNFSGWLL